MNASRDLEMGRAAKSRTHVYPHNFSPGRRVVYDLGDSEREWTPWLVSMIVLVNIAMFFVIMFVNNCPKNHNRLLGDCVASFLRRFSFQPLRENPLLAPPPQRKLQKLGALEWDKIIQHKQAWRLVTSAWLHAGVVHLLANMLSLLFIGIRLEQQFGFVRVGIIYFLSGIGGSVLSSLFIQRSISVGASGAVFGLLGAMLSELFTNWTIYTNKAAALVTLIVIIAINLAVGILPHVDNFAHIGGFLTGFLLGFVLLVRPQFGWSENHRTQLKSKYTIYQYILWITSLVLVITGLVVGLVMVFKGVNGNEKCKWCHYLSCVPTSKWNCNK